MNAQKQIENTEKIQAIFREWNERKITMHLYNTRYFPKQGEVWICDFGVNVGSEQNNIRPALVINKPIAGERTCTIIPASNTYRDFCITVEDFNFLPHQIRTVDTKRFKRRIYRISKESLEGVMKKFFQLQK